jgi:hypothetical protein
MHDGRHSVPAVLLVAQPLSGRDVSFDGLWTVP